MLKRRKTKRKRKDPFHVPGHAQYVRGFECCVGPFYCAGKVEAHHCRKDLPVKERGSTGKKPHDKWLVPLCHHHHIEDFHVVGVDSFEAYHNVSLNNVAMTLWRYSPPAKRWTLGMEKE